MQRVLTASSGVSELTLSDFLKFEREKQFLLFTPSKKNVGFLFTFLFLLFFGSNSLSFICDFALVGLALRANFLSYAFTLHDFIFYLLSFVVSFLSSTVIRNISISGRQ